MREVIVSPAERRTKSGPVHRLQFGADGRELVAWVEPRPGAYGRLTGITGRLYARDLAADSVRQLPPADWFDSWGEVSCRLAVSPDLRLLAAEVNPGDGETEGFVYFCDLREPDVRLPELELAPVGASALLFTADGSALVAVQPVWEGDGYNTADVLRFDTKAFTLPPVRYKPGVDPVSGEPVRGLNVRPRWKPAVAVSTGAPAAAAAVSANGRLVAVGTAEGTVHVTDLRKRQWLVSFAWEGRKLRDRVVTRVGFDPAGEWVASVAGGRLFARPLGAGESWHTKDALGRVNDFAYHPEGRAVCAVFDDGQARSLDPHTGAVRQSFRWSKKPKPLYSVAFAPDGLTCAAGAGSGKVVVWDVDA